MLVVGYGLEKQCRVEECGEKVIDKAEALNVGCECRGMLWNEMILSFGITMVTGRNDGGASPAK